MSEQKKTAIAVLVASMVVSIITAAALVAFGYSWYQYGFADALEAIVKVFSELLVAVVVSLFALLLLLALFSCVFMIVARLMGVKFPAEEAV